MIIYEDFDRLANVITGLEDLRCRIGSGMERVIAIEEELGRDIIADMYMSVSIGQVSERMEKNMRRFT